MGALDYKGVKSTRFVLMVLLITMGSIFFSLNMITEAGWLELVKWVFGIYSTSEGAAKAATAYRGKSDG